VILLLGSIDKETENKIQSLIMMDEHNNNNSAHDSKDKSDQGRETQMLTVTNTELTPSSFTDIFPTILRPRFDITSKDLSDLSKDRSRDAFIQVFQNFILSSETSVSGGDIESPNAMGKARGLIQEMIRVLTQDQDFVVYKEQQNIPLTMQEEDILNKNMEIAAIALTTIILRSSPEKGLSLNSDNVESEGNDALVGKYNLEESTNDDMHPVLAYRADIFGRNAIKEKKLKSFLHLCYEAVQDFVLIMLIIMGVVTIAVETTIGLEEGEKCGSCWLEGFAILTSVTIVVLVTAGIDYMKQIAFQKLSRNLELRNTKSVIRDGEQVVVTDADIVVGDVLSVNSHSLASIPADCVLLGPSMDLKVDESSLTGESHTVSKNPGDVVLSGTNAVQGSGKMVVIAVGKHSVAGKIKARVYESADAEGSMEGDEETPLYQKLDMIAKQIGWAGTFAALLAFIVSASIGLGHHKEDIKELIRYFIVAVTVLAVAVPEGLPLAVVLALAFSSNKMMGENNMVKTLAACETMGCATTICTDKTGTLTANKMTARAIYTTGKNYVCQDPKMTLGAFMISSNPPPPPDYDIHDLISRTISICTMNETSRTIENGVVSSSSGNPTEVALLTLVHELGSNYRIIRACTRGRSDVGELASYLHEGKLLNFTSARKMMSWAVPLESGGFRLYCKGASEVIFARSSMEVDSDLQVKNISKDEMKKLTSVAEQYARRGMRCLGLAYKDLPSDFEFDETTSMVKNADGTDAFLCETDLTFVALVGIEDPLRPEVPDAIQMCYEAGIDVRLVTGDSPNTAVSIAFQSGILRANHFLDSSTEMVAENLKPNVLMDGKTFRSKVYKKSKDGNQEFDQEAFDEIWPFLRVLARSSPDDKLTLAHGLNQSVLFKDKLRCKKLLRDHQVRIFPDRQVVAMTGDGTNDAPALKRADIGFAMGIAGTQIAKDAADIILMDDNFASIVTGESSVYMFLFYFQCATMNIQQISHCTKLQLQNGVVMCMHLFKSFSSFN
jgi:P-type Ca2+ transporter type 2B